MTDPKIVDPAAQDRIDFRNHFLYWPAHMLSEDLPEVFKQRGPLLQLGRIVRPPLPPKAQYPPILEPQEGKALSLFQAMRENSWNCSIDGHSEKWVLG